MNQAIDTFHDIWRYIHIAAGFVGLAVFWVPVFARKGKGVHVWSGKVFSVCAWIVGLTAVGSGLWALAWPAGFVGGVPTGGASEQDLAQLRWFALLLGFLGMALLQAVCLGTRMIETKKEPEKLANIPVRALTAGLTVWGGLMAAYGIYLLTQGLMGGGASILIALGAVGVVSGVGDWRFLKNPRPTKMAWWYKHMECMIGCGIAFHTAFLVFGMSRIVGMEVFTGGWTLVGWLAPTAIGLPATVIWTRYYRRKFGELDAKRPAASGVADRA